MKKTIIFLAIISTLFICQCSEPNPPNWPNSVKIISPGQANAQGIIDQIYQELGGHSPAFHGQWSNSRYALLFKPGDHSNLNVNVGYYTTVAGLGKSPRDVNIGNVAAENGDFNFQGGALSNFWRSAENFMTTPTKNWFGNVAMLWAVSQASPLRRVVVNGDLLLFQYNKGDDAGFASGGYMSNSQINGKVMSGSQQQWFSRNCDFGQWVGGVWNMVFVGCQNAPQDKCQTGESLVSNTKITPVIAEKPYITYRNSKYYLTIPPLQKNKVGATQNDQQAQDVDFSNVFVASPQTTVDEMNQKLSRGQHLVFTPGIYKLNKSIQVTQPNTVILGLGMATLISGNGQPCIVVQNVDGVRIASVILEAGQVKSTTLLQWGNHGYQGNYANPGFAYDLFARVGGDLQNVSTQYMVQINSGNVVLDNTWLWRADHSASGLVYNSQNPVQTGLQVNGDNVIGYGVAVEHTLGDMLEWNGENGQTYFYQSEFPYDVTQQNYGDLNYSAYKVKHTVKNHKAHGVGVYSFFRDYSVNIQSGIKAPVTSGVQFKNSLSVILNGKGSIKHVINDQGASINQSGTQSYVCNYPNVYQTFLSQ